MFTHSVPFYFVGVHFVRIRKEFISGFLWGGSFIICLCGATAALSFPGFNPGEIGAARGVLKKLSFSRF